MPNKTKEALSKKGYIDFRYVESTRNRHHLGTPARPSFCDCTYFGGSCISPIERGEPTIVARQHIWKSPDGKAHIQIWRFKHACYFMLLPSFEDTYFRNRQETHAELQRWPELHNFFDHIAQRKLDREDERLLQKQNNPISPHLRYQTETAKLRAQLRARIAAIDGWMKRPIKQQLTAEQATQRAARAYQKKLGLEAELALLVPDVESAS